MGASDTIRDVRCATIRRMAWGLLLAACTASLSAQTITVRDGASMHLNSALVAARCHDMEIDGVLTLEDGQLTQVDNLGGNGSLVGGAGTVRLSGEFDIADYQAEASRLHIDDQCQSSQVRVVGAREFYHFSAATGTTRTLFFDAGTTQTFAGSLSLSGSAGQPLLLRTTTSGAEVFFDLADGAAQSYSWVDVADNHAVGVSLAPGPVERYDAVDSGNLLRWFELEIFRDRFEFVP